MLATLSAFLAGGAIALVAAGFVAKKYQSVFDDFVAFIRK